MIYSKTVTGVRITCYALSVTLFLIAGCDDGPPEQQQQARSADSAEPPFAVDGLAAIPGADQLRFDRHLASELEKVDAALAGWESETVAEAV